MNEETTVNVHWSFWVIGAVGLIFNLMGCINFISQMSAENVASMPDAYRAIIDSRPTWGTAAFAVAVFGGLLGCLFLLLRNSIATYVFFLALIAAIVAQIPFFGMADFPAAAWFGWLSQVGVGAFLIWYSKLAARKGWIRGSRLPAEQEQ